MKRNPLAIALSVVGNVAGTGTIAVLLSTVIYNTAAWTYTHLGLVGAVAFVLAVGTLITLDANYRGTKAAKKAQGE